MAGLVAGAAPAYAAPSAADCIAHTANAQVHYSVDFVGVTTVISALTITGFDASSCDGLPVTVVISGNSAGDPALNGDPAAMHTLSTLDSSLTPCAAAPASVIAGGSITLSGCAGEADPSRAAYASLHDTTELTVTVAGQSVPVIIGPNVPPPPNPSSSSPVPSASVSSSVDATSVHRTAVPTSSESDQSLGVAGTQASRGGGSLAFTGVQVLTLVCIAGLFVLVGALVILAGRRRGRGHAH